MAVISDLRQGNQLIWEAITTGLRVEPNLKMKRKLSKKFVLSIAIFFSSSLRIGQVKRKKSRKEIGRNHATSTTILQFDKKT